jgi:hypothetical protein
MSRTCHDFNMCENCSEKHEPSHSLLTYYKHVSLKLDNHDEQVTNMLATIPYSAALIGEGSFCKVYLTMFNGNKIACKEYKENKNEKSVKYCEREIDVYNEIAGDNILKMIGYFEN